MASLAQAKAEVGAGVEAKVDQHSFFSGFVYVQFPETCLLQLSFLNQTSKDLLRR